MAAYGQPVVGYECEFVGQVPEDYFCKKCKHVAREPQVTSCCIEAICKVCFDYIVQDQEACPNCKDNDVKNYGPHNRFGHKIELLKVYCTLRGRGCQWTGQLGHLDDHLDLGTGDCQHVDVTCPLNCDQVIQKHNTDTHVNGECLNRPYTCEYCEYQATFQDIARHYEVCTKFPIECRNKCEGTFERELLEVHMRSCPLQMVECEAPGCRDRFLRRATEDHRKENTQKHIALMGTTIQELSKKLCSKTTELAEQREALEQKQEALEVKVESQRQELQQQKEDFEEQNQVLQQQKEESDQKQETLEQSVEDLKQEIQQLREEFEQEKREFKEKLDEQKHESEQRLKELEQKGKETHSIYMNKLNMEQGLLPYSITLAGYQKTMEPSSKSYIDSPPMYTHPGGYRIQLTLWPGGLDEGLDTHVSLTVYVVRGEYDSRLQFPAKFAVAVELVNQHSDQEHMLMKIECKVVERRKGVVPLNNLIGSLAQFFPHADLDLNTERGTQYLKNDCLKIRISDITLHK